MRRSLTALTAWALFATPLWAEPFVVRSGEHPEFTRLVVEFKGNDWTVSQTGRDVELRYRGYEEGFDIGRIFDLIPRTRIADVTSDPSVIKVTLSCDCVVGAFLERDQYVVLDIAADTDALIGPVVAPTLAEVEQPQPDIETAETTDGTDAVQFSPPSNESSTLEATERVAVLPEGTDFFPSRSPLPDGSQEVIENLQDRLSVELKSATQRGVLSAVPGPVELQSQTRPHVDTTIFAEIPPAQDSDPEQEAPEGPLANLRISTSRDLPESFRDLTEIITNTGQVCPPEDSMAMASWGDERPFAPQIAEARHGLYGEFDRIDPEAAINLAKTYLYFGFGAEARSVLMLDPEIAKDAAHLLTIALILDGESPDADNELSGLARCPGDAPLWATLAAPMPLAGSLPPSEAALRALNTLPAHLRIIIAPKLNTALLAYGDPTGAATALRSLDRLAQQLPAEVKLAQAKTDLKSGKTEEGAEQLKEVADENVAQSPEALIALVDVRRQTNQPIDVETASLIEAYAQELQDGPLGPSLQRAHIIALVESGQFDRAFATKEDRPKGITERQHDDLVEYMMSALTASASDVVFLDHVFGMHERDIKSLPKDDLLALAARFLDLGFADRAEQTMTHLPRPLGTEAQRMVSARIALALGRPVRAESALADITGTDADLMRAQARRMKGDHSGAHEIYAQMERTQDATETAWLADNWRSLTAPDAPVFGPASALVSAEETTTSEAAGMLTRSAAVLEQSELARKTLQDLLGSGDLQLDTPTE